MVCLITVCIYIYIYIRYVWCVHLTKICTSANSGKFLGSWVKSNSKVWANRVRDINHRESTSNGYNKGRTTRGPTSSIATAIAHLGIRTRVCFQLPQNDLWSVHAICLSVSAAIWDLETSVRLCKGSAMGGVHCKIQVTAVLLLFLWQKKWEQQNSHLAILGWYLTMSAVMRVLSAVHIYSDLPC